jgi:ElaB/YqjD/DUF883 family membrane-anchored ribosome-binding protein
MSERKDRDIETTQKQMEEMMGQMKAQLENISNELQVRTGEAMDKGREMVRERPLASVGIAFGVGLVVGAILIKALDRD